VVDFLFVGSIFSALIAIFLMLFRNKNQNQYADGILVFLFACYIYCSIGYLLISSGWIIHVPFLYRTSAPVNYLVPPLAFLYVRAVLLNQEIFNKYDWIHILPFLFILINYTFYFLRYDQKLKVVHSVVTDYTQNYKHQDGFFNENIQLLRPVQCIIYLILQWSIILKFEHNQQNSTFKVHTQLVVRWLKKFTVAVSLTVITYVIFAIGFLFKIQNVESPENIYLISSITVSLSLLYLTMNVVLHDKVYIGLPYLEPFKSNKLTKPKVEIDYKKELDLIKSYFEGQQPYLKANLTISEVSVSTGIHIKTLSFILNQFYNQNFNEFVNTYRIRYVIELLKKGVLKDYTLSAICSKAGFSNKTSFIDAFKKSQNCTPTQFIFNNRIE
jgi:AraC-like DNA-binding protein